MEAFGKANWGESSAGGTGNQAKCIAILLQGLNPNTTQPSDNGTYLNCTTESNVTPFVYTFGTMFFAYLTPIIIIIGLIGNSISLNVFTSKHMRKQSASYYLAALSMTDILVLVTSVMFDWVKRGLPELPGEIRIPYFDVNGVCHVFLYLSYVSRFLSVWLLVMFTCERYIGVCHPLKRRKICTISSARRIIGAIVLFAMALGSYKPALSGVYEVFPDTFRCTRNREYQLLSFILDSIFGLLITLVPLLTILVLNMLIVRKLFLRNRSQRMNGMCKTENKIRIEFTVILLSISTCFVTLNLPYFIVWFYQWFFSREQNRGMDDRLLEKAERLVPYGVVSGALLIVRPIFYVNYCINFFLYSITGAFFRKEMKKVFTYKFHRNSDNRLSKSMTSQSPQSWV
ncbi:putative G-protein coupled receptor 139 [Tubulanus polymorphus]|uniref:putative G-protein coupled receptor 139 n=1 Tax=Tubulanus polymorphus TaxID=672921 RepID=UPI003DA3DFE4